MTSTRPDPTDEASPGQAPTSRRARLFVGVAWIGVAVIAAMLIAQRHAQAMSSGLGADLEIFLDAATIARAGGDVYDAVGYTYTPLLAWLLMPLAGTDASMAVWTAIQLACGAVAVALVVVTLRDRLPGWRAPLIAGIGVVSLFYNSKLVLESSLGQTQLLLLAVIALAVLLGRRSPIASGIVLMVAALVKTWPAMLLLWLLRAGQPRRLAAVLAALVTLVAFVAVMVAVSGWQSIGRLIGRTLGLSQQPLDLYSVWFFARQAVPGADIPLPLSESPIAGIAVSGTLAVVLLGLVVLVLRRPGDPSLAMWNLAGATVLLLPASHPFYHLLMLPLLWVWSAILLSTTRPWFEPAIAVGTLLIWWALAFRSRTYEDGWLHFASVVAAIIALTVSVVLSARLDRRPAGAVVR